MTAGLTMRQAAEALGVTRTAVWSWEHGKFPRVSRLHEVAALYGCEVEDLLPCDPRR